MDLSSEVALSCAAVLLSIKASCIERLVLCEGGEKVRVIKKLPADPWRVEFVCFRSLLSLICHKTKGE